MDGRGVVKTFRRLDREAIPLYRLLVLAVDHGGWWWCWCGGGGVVVVVVVW